MGGLSAAGPSAAEGAIADRQTAREIAGGVAAKRDQLVKLDHRTSGLVCCSARRIIIWIRREFALNHPVFSDLLRSDNRFRRDSIIRPVIAGNAIYPATGMASCFLNLAGFRLDHRSYREFLFEPHQRIGSRKFSAHNLKPVRRLTFSQLRSFKSLSTTTPCLGLTIVVIGPIRTAAIPL